MFDEENTKNKREQNEYKLILTLHLPGGGDTISGTDDTWNLEIFLTGVPEDDEPASDSIAASFSSFWKI